MTLVMVKYGEFVGTVKEAMELALKWKAQFKITYNS